MSNLLQERHSEVCLGHEQRNSTSQLKKHLKHTQLLVARRIEEESDAGAAALKPAGMRRGINKLVAGNVVVRISTEESLSPRKIMNKKPCDL